MEVKARLTTLVIQLNPVALRTSIDAKVTLLWKIVYLLYCYCFDDQASLA